MRVGSNDSFLPRCKDGYTSGAALLDFDNAISSISNSCCSSGSFYSSAPFCSFKAPYEDRAFFNCICYCSSDYFSIISSSFFSSGCPSGYSSCYWSGYPSGCSGLSDLYSSDYSTFTPTIYRSSAPNMLRNAYMFKAETTMSSEVSTFSWT